jgi:hypothetical protein
MRLRKGPLEGFIEVQRAVNQAMSPYRDFERAASTALGQVAKASQIGANFRALVGLDSEVRRAMEIGGLAKLTLASVRAGELASEAAATRFQTAEAAIRAGEQMARELRGVTQSFDDLKRNTTSLVEQIWALNVKLENQRLLEQLGFDTAKLSSPTGLMARYAGDLRRAREAFDSSIGNTSTGLLGWNPFADFTAILETLRVDIVAPDQSALVSTELGGMLTWLEPHQNDDWRLRSSGLLRDHLRRTAPPGQQVRVRCEVRCKFCGDEMVQDEAIFDVSGQMVDTVEINVVPLCVTCLRRQERDPRFFESALSEMTSFKSTSLTLVEGTAEELSEPRGRSILHLVASPSEIDETESEE